MMFERFTPDARTVVIHAQEHAYRLGHRFIGPEHLLLAVVATGEPASAVLREQGITPERVEEEIVRHTGLGAGAGLFGGLDRDALSAIGVDLDAVRARIEASFGPEALTRAAFVTHPGPRTSRLNPRRAIPPSLARRLRRRRHARLAVPVAPAPGLRQAAAAGAVPADHLPFTPRARKILENSLREAQALHDQHIGIEHVALGLLETKSGLVPPVLLALGASGPALRAAILDRYRKAS
jgi:Clp amino terminal domain, pathogenicity island component